MKWLKASVLAWLLICTPSYGATLDQAFEFFFTGDKGWGSLNHLVEGCKVTTYNNTPTMSGLQAIDVTNDFKKALFDAVDLESTSLGIVWYIPCKGECTSSRHSSPGYSELFDRRQIRAKNGLYSQKAVERVLRAIEVIRDHCESVTSAF